jgi:hypothetical protein
MDSKIMLRGGGERSGGISLWTQTLVFATADSSLTNNLEIQQPKPQQEIFDQPLYYSITHVHVIGCQQNLPA